MDSAFCGQSLRGGTGAAAPGAGHVGAEADLTAYGLELERYLERPMQRFGLACKSNAMKTRNESGSSHAELAVSAAPLESHLRCGRRKWSLSAQAAEETKPVMDMDMEGHSRAHMRRKRKKNSGLRRLFGRLGSEKGKASLVEQFVV